MRGECSLPAALLDTGQGSGTTHVPKSGDAFGAVYRALGYFVQRRELL